MISPIQQHIRAFACEKRATKARTFFKTNAGQYGEHDQFMGIAVPTIRTIAKKFRDTSGADIAILLQSPFNEERLLGLLIIIEQYKKADEVTQDRLFYLTLDNIHHINNWNLVDTIAPTVIGAYLFDKDRSLLAKFTHDAQLWKRRIAIVATLHFIRHDHYHDTLTLARMLLHDHEDLIHKATGWMLREVGKRDQQVLEHFLGEYHHLMPRTMLRYAIEKFPLTQRLYYLQKKK